MLTSSALLDQKLDQLEQKIIRYKALLNNNFKCLSFPSTIEKDYRLKNDKLFIKSSRGVLFFGILIYLLFGFADNALGFERAVDLLIIRATLALLLGTALIFVLHKKLIRCAAHIATVGMTLIGLSIILFMSMLKEPYSFAYHLGMIPWQVFVLVALRTYSRAIFASSIIVFSSYIGFVYSHDFQLFNSELDALALDLKLVFIVFWALLILIGVYLGYFMEKFSRQDYLNNKLLSLEAERLTLLSEELKLLSTTDSLTGLANRRHFEHCFESEWSRALRTKEPVFLLMIDIDYFKNYNDYYGHQAGDNCLKHVSDVLTTFAQRSGELASRYGGEEFLVLLPRLNLDQGLVVAKKLCNTIEELNIPHAGIDLGHLTVSVGVAAVVPELEDDMSDLIRASDTALYRAKNTGRNRVST